MIYFQNNSNIIILNLSKITRNIKLFKLFIHFFSKHTDIFTKWIKNMFEIFQKMLIIKNNESKYIYILLFVRNENIKLNFHPLQNARYQ